MATIGENIDTLLAYWREANSYNAASISIEQKILLLQKLGNAKRAMAELTKSAMDTTARPLFAGASIFETALTAEAPGITDALLAMGSFSDARPPRQMMLDAIFAKSSGGWWSSPEPAGLSSWIHSTYVAGGAVMSTLTSDPVPDVRTAMCQCFGLAFPQEWGSMLTNGRTFENAQTSLQTVAWPASVRAAVASKLNEAQGRVRTVAALSMPLPSFPIGDGSMVPTLPPASKPWWRLGQLWAGGAVGLVGGAYASVRGSRRA